MDASASHPNDLTPREQAILGRLARGLSDQQIADEMFLSLHTVKWYNRQMYRKLGVGSRTQAIAQASTRGVLADSALPGPSSAALASAPVPASRSNASFTRSFDGTRIAYGVAGSGPPLVKVANYMSHVDHDWESPVWRHWMEELARNRTLVYYDERGTGLSDPDAEDVSFDAWVRDVDAVVDAAGLERFALFGMSQGAAVAVAYAVLHPKKVTRLVVHGGYARGWLNRDLTPAQVEEEALMISLMRVGWGRENPAFRQVFAMQLFPGASMEHLNALEEQMRISVAPGNAVRLEAEMHRIDIRDLARQITVPTLILHSRADEAVPFEEGRLMASLIPGAQFVALESRNHLLTAQEPAWSKFTAAVRGFLDDGT